MFNTVLRIRNCLIVMWQQPSGRIISMGLNLLQSLERTTKTKWRWQVRKGDGKLSIASTRNILLTIKECEIQYNSQKKPLCCSAHLQDVFRNSVPHDASIKIHIFLLFLGRNSPFHHLWVSIKTRNNYFLYNNPKSFFLKITVNKDWDNALFTTAGSIF